MNCAALLVSRRAYDEIDLGEWDRMFAVNVRGSFLCARAAAVAMGDRGGSIVNVASETAVTGSHGFVHYVASKGAVIAMTLCRPTELGPRGLRLPNCVAPGFTPTPGSEVLGAYDPSRTPLGRVMRPDDLLGTFCYLLSDDAAFVSGQTLLVNGGRVPPLTWALGHVGRHQRRRGGSLGGVSALGDDHRQADGDENGPWSRPGPGAPRCSRSASPWTSSTPWPGRPS